MHACDTAPDFRTPAQQAVVDLVVAEGFKPEQVEPVERFAFYEKIKGASLIVQSGEGSGYGNAAFCKGVIFSDEYCRFHARHAGLQPCGHAPVQ